MTGFKKSGILVIGPLPPPNGGARVSFRLFLDHLRGLEGLGIHHYDLPVRRNRGGNPPGGTDHLRTMFQMVRIILEMPLRDRVVIFGSNRFAFSYGLLLILWAKLWNKKPVVRFFGGQPLHTVHRLPATVDRLRLALLGLAERIIVQTRYGADQFPKRFTPKIRVVPGYRNRPGTRVVRTARQNGDPLKLLYTGRVHPDKGIDILAESYRQVRQNVHEKVEWHVYGAGSPEVVGRLAAMPGVCYHGSVNHDRLVREISAYDLFVLPTHYDLEGHPGSLLEALMAGLPAVVSDHPCVREIVRDGYNGLVVPQNDSTALAEVLWKLYRDPALLQRLAQGAAQSAGRFEAGRQLDRLIRICIDDF